MSIDQEMEEILQLFFEESFEGLDTMESGLLTLDNSADRETINTIFRAAHSIKGGAGTFGFMEISGFTHSVETLLDEMRNGTRGITPDALQVLLQSVDVIREMVRSALAKRPIVMVGAAAPTMTIGRFACADRTISRITSTDCNSTCNASGVMPRVPLRISSSSVSTECVKPDISMNPNVPAPPLIECAARKMVLMVSRSALLSSVNSPDSMVSRPSKLSSKKSCRISSISWSIDMELQNLGDRC